MKQFKERIKEIMDKITTTLDKGWDWYCRCLEKHYYLTIAITAIPIAALIQLYIELCLKR